MGSELAVTERLNQLQVSLDKVEKSLATISTAMVPKQTTEPGYMTLGFIISLMIVLYERFAGMTQLALSPQKLNESRKTIMNLRIKSNSAQAIGQLKPFPTQCGGFHGLSVVKLFG